MTMEVQKEHQAESETRMSLMAQLWKLSLYQV
jgi:hypothetical protein